MLLEMMHACHVVTFAVLDWLELLVVLRLLFFAAFDTSESCVSGDAWLLLRLALAARRLVVEAGMSLVRRDVRRDDWRAVSSIGLSSTGCFNTDAS